MTPAERHPRLGKGERIERDLTGQILELHALESYWSEPPRLEGSLARLETSQEFVSAAALMQKAKQFDDGLYAAVELAALHGCGERRAKTGWLAGLRAALGTDRAATSLYAAARVLDPDAEVPESLAQSVSQRIMEFQADELSSKPISFYTWTAELVALFQHDRLLQGTLCTEELVPLVQSLHSRPDVRADYEGYLGLIERLTNPLTEDHVRRALCALDEAPEPSLDDASFLPPSVSPEVELAKKMYGDTPIPEGFELMTELLARVRSRAIDLRPTADSGWYDHQVWSLEPLVIPRETAEATHLSFTAEYREHLEDLCKGAWALTRETHAKQLEYGELTCAYSPPAKPELVVQPELSCEPLVTHYRRRADSYRFVRRVIEDYFGANALRTMHRLTIDGSVERTLDAELDFMLGLFEGAATTCEREIGASAADRGDAENVFTRWDLTQDPDLSTDVRMMVPVFYDEGRRRTKVWAVLGWSERDLLISFKQSPGIVVRNIAGRDITENYDIQFGTRSHTIAYAEFAEVYVDRILDRDEFRALCDEHGSREKILAAL